MPFQRTDPASSAVRPKMARIAVVLPAPLGPRNPTTWPEGTEKESPSRAVTGPNRRVSPSSSKRPLTGPRLEGGGRAIEASPRRHRGEEVAAPTGIAAAAPLRRGAAVPSGARRTVALAGSAAYVGRGSW